MNVKKTLSVVATVAMVAGWSGLAGAISVPVYGPICDANARVKSTTYYSCSGSSHTALDIANGSCGEYNHRAMLGGSFYYQYYGGCAAACYGSSCNGGAGNYVVVRGSDGWDFRQLHIWGNHHSYSKSCDRCVLGLVGGTGNVTGPHVHAENRQYGVRHSSWYVVVGTTCDCTNIIDSATL